ncbi:MAG: PDZ domain-containing protein [Planctomycetota bacterium]|nr:PDZ domain-containing protein [Planctomycetota bacterium]
MMNHPNRPRSVIRFLVTGALSSYLAIVVSWGELHAQDDLLQAEERALQQAVEKVSPSVVQIEVLGGLETISDGPVTGLAVSADGFILSSATNFQGTMTAILVSTPSGKRASATIVAHDYNRKLVLLKVNTPEVYPLTVAVPHKEMVVGQWAVAIGKTYSRETANQSVGIISATNRIWGKAVQTDAKISPANYGGPLIDIYGRVYGILTPLSPHGGGGPTEGTEWYDSGIGFAIPLVDILPQLDKLKAGKDLYPGRLGISLKTGDIYDLPAEVVSVQPKSPARTAGMQKGDTIIKINDMVISRQAQLRHALGGKYAGDLITVSYRRGENVLSTDVTLVEKLQPYEHPLLGILPDRNHEEAGVKVRYVYPESAAAKITLQTGDIITAVNSEEVADAATLRLLLSNYEPKNEISITFVRNNQPVTNTLMLGSLPTFNPDIPPHESPTKPAPANPLATGFVNVKLPEEKNECIALVPDNYRHDVPHALVVWLHAPGDQDDEALKTQWSALGEQYQLIVLAPRSADQARWNPTQLDFIRKTIDNLITTYNIDRTRIVVHGRQAGGSMSYMLGFSHRDLIRGVAPVDAALPARAAVEANDPALRLAFYAFHVKGSRLEAASQTGLDRLKKAKYPVSAIQIDGMQGITNAQRSHFVQWIDSLDRL